MPSRPRTDYFDLSHRILRPIKPRLLVDLPIPDYLANRPVIRRVRNAGRSRQCLSQKHKPSHGRDLESLRSQYARFVHVAPSLMDWQPRKRRTMGSALKIHTRGEGFIVQLSHTENPTCALRCLRK